MERAQRIAARVVRRVLAGTNVSGAQATEIHDSAAHERALVQELAYGSLRFLGQLRGIVHHLAERAIPDPDVEALLWVALYQLLHTRAPHHAIVDGAVRATARMGHGSAKGMVNAILRNFIRRRDVILGAVGRDPEGRFSYPLWWIERVRREHPGRYAEILDAGNTRPPFALRVNRRQIARDEYLALLAREDIAASAIGIDGVIVAQPRATTELPGFAQGQFSVQDAGAQIAARLLAVEGGMRVLDACAAPGGKTTHLAELADIDLTALDNDPQRLTRVRDNLARLKLSARVIAADALDTAQWWDRVAFDRILVDVPCTASGVIRRHPDAKWLRRESDIDSFRAMQSSILDALWPCLARDGRLLYATCSIFHAENDAQIEAFLARHADASHMPLVWPSPVNAVGGQLLPGTSGAAHNHDGFFYALLQKH